MYPPPQTGDVVGLPTGVETVGGVVSTVSLEFVVDGLEGVGTSPERLRVWLDRSIDPFDGSVAVSENSVLVASPDSGAVVGFVVGKAVVVSSGEAVDSGVVDTPGPLIGTDDDWEVLTPDVETSVGPEALIVLVLGSPLVSPALELKKAEVLDSANGVVSGAVLDDSMLLGDVVPLLGLYPELVKDLDEAGLEESVPDTSLLAILVGMLVRVTSECDDEGIAVVGLVVGPSLPEVEGRMVSVTPLVLIIVTFVVASSVLVAFLLLE